MHYEENQMTKLNPILLTDIIRYEIPSVLKYSPDGLWLAFQVKSSDPEKNKYRTNVWLSRDGRAYQATWSLDASIVDWLDDENLILVRNTEETQTGTTALYLLNVHGGEARPWMTLPFAMGGFKKISDTLYAATGTIDEDAPDAYLDNEDQRKARMDKKLKETDYQIVDEVPYWFNGRGFVNKTRTALFLITMKGPDDRHPVFKRITAPDFDVDSVAIHENLIYYSGNVVKGKHSVFTKVYCFDAGTRKKTSIYTKNGMNISGLFVLEGCLYGQASDLKTYGCNETPNICRIEKNKLTVCYVPEVSLNNSMVGDTTGSGMTRKVFEDTYYTLATVEAHTAIFALKEDELSPASVNLAATDAAAMSPDSVSTPGHCGFAKKTIWDEEGMICALDVSANKIAVIYQDWKHICEVYEMEKDGIGLTRITSLNDAMLKGRYIAYPNRVDYSSEGENLRGWVLLPDKFNPRKKYPAVLDIHGGPRCVYGETFFHEMQLWAARGYIVFFTNIRGSDGRGDAFADIRDQYGYVDFRNLMDFTDKVLETYPCIDTGKVCVTGGSYGGFMTNWIIGHTDRFCCAASQRSISNWISFSFLSDIGEMFGPDQCGAPGLFGDKNTETLWKHSPLKYADQVKTPTLFIHSNEDYRCPIAEGMQMMQALADSGVETRMCIFRGENHELSRNGRPQHRVKRLKEITEWFDSHIRGL